MKHYHSGRHIELGVGLLEQIGVQVNLVRCDQIDRLVGQIVAAGLFDVELGLGRLLWVIHEHVLQVVCDTYFKRQQKKIFDTSISI